MEIKFRWNTGTVAGAVVAGVLVVWVALDILGRLFAAVDAWKDVDSWWTSLSPTDQLKYKVLTELIIAGVAASWSFLWMWRRQQRTISQLEGKQQKMNDAMTQLNIIVRLKPWRDDFMEKRRKLEETLERFKKFAEDPPVQPIIQFNYKLEELRPLFRELASPYGTPLPLRPDAAPQPLPKYENVPEQFRQQFVNVYVTFHQRKQQYSEYISRLNGDIYRAEEEFLKYAPSDMPVFGRMP